MGKSKTRDEIISKFVSIYGNKYDYSRVNYVNNSTKVEIICPTHGIFKVAPNNFYRGYGCPQCNHARKFDGMRKTKEMFISQANIVHKNKYNYSKVEYKNNETPVCIICPIHGEFWQNPSNHLKGYGCRLCGTTSKGEDRIYNYLASNKIEHIRQYKVRNESLFCSNINLVVDFFIPSCNTVIEYNGIQHYKMGHFTNKEENFILQQERDMALRQYCKEHKIKLIEIPYTEYDNIENILSKELKIHKNKA